MPPNIISTDFSRKNHTSLIRVLCHFYHQCYYQFLLVAMLLRLSKLIYLVSSAQPVDQQGHTLQGLYLNVCTTGAWSVLIDDS